MGAREQKGRFTLPVDVGLGDDLKTLAEKWGVDAVRNSDGTELPPDIAELGMTVYSTISLTRADQVWARAHGDQLTQKFLVSDPRVATSDTLEIDLMSGYFDEQFAIDTVHDPAKWFEVNDRTAGTVIDPASWEFDPGTGLLTIHGAEQYHVYTVTFLVYQIWDTTSMYNHVTNKWTGEHVRPLDPRQPETRRHLIEYLENWLEENPQTDVVRLTSLAYHFTNNFQRAGDSIRSRYRDWVGYHDCTSVLALEEFEKAKGYALRPEDIGDQGYMNDVRQRGTRCGPRTLATRDT
jgi:1,3-beta-galactosyl-N-acetylhexosamine phosphorylase